MVSGPKMLIAKVVRNRSSSKSQVFIKNVLTFFQRKATLKTTDIPPSSSASISVFWGRSHVEDHVRSCIGIQTYNTYADGNSCTSSFEGLAGASLTLTNRARRSNCLRRCRTPPPRNFYTVRACASLGPAPLPRRSVPPCSLIKIYNYYYLSGRGDQAVSRHRVFIAGQAEQQRITFYCKLALYFLKNLEVSFAGVYFWKQNLLAVSRQGEGWTTEGLIGESLDKFVCFFGKKGGKGGRRVARNGKEDQVLIQQIYSQRVYYKIYRPLCQILKTKPLSSKQHESLLFQMIYAGYRAYCIVLPIFIINQMQSTGSKISLEQDLIKNQIGPFALNKKAHVNSIESLAVQPSGKIFATGSHDKTIKLWDVGTFKEAMTLSDHKQGVWSLDYSKDGNLLASGSPDKSVLIWDSKKASPGTKINAHKGKVYATRFNQSSKLLATCGETGEIFIWDLAKTKQPLKKLQVNSLIAYDIEWSNNEQLFFVTTLGSQLLAYDSKTFTEISQHFVTENMHDSKCESVAANFKLIDRRVFCGTHRGHIAWYEMNNNKLVKEAEFLAHLDSVRTINYHPNRKILLSTGRDGSAKLWNAESNTHHPAILGNLVQHSENIPGAGFINSQLVVTGSWDQHLCLWNVKDLLK